MSNQLRTIESICSSLGRAKEQPLAVPEYTGDSNLGIGLAVESMKRHTTDEGWQIFAGLEHSGYKLYGHWLENSNTNVREILTTNPGIVVMQDKREWDVSKGSFRDDQAKFHCVDSLKGRSDIFKLTILKDAHQRPAYHRESALEIGCHAWIIYYHPKIVHHLAPYVRSEHLIRTYHSIDSSIVPDFSMANRGGCLLSGAVSSAYPLRKRLIEHVSYLPHTTILQHPGYHRNGPNNPDFMKCLSHYKVAICTSSIYGYSLRKIIEATACGCRVLTDLPVDDYLPNIDKNLIRIPHETTAQGLSLILQHLYDTYDPNTQFDFAKAAREYYDYKASGLRLVQDIASMRYSYSSGKEAA